MFSFIKSQKGAVAIEFALALFPFLTLVTILIELLFLVYQSVGVEYLNSQAAKYSSSFSYHYDYRTKYLEYLNSKTSNIGFFLRNGSYTVDLQFCKNLKELSSNSCSGSNSDAKIVVYELNYKVFPIFLFNWIDKKKRIKTRTAYFLQKGKFSEVVQ